MQQLEFIFHVTLNTDAKNLAIDKLKSHRKRTSAEGEATVEHDPVHRLAGDLAGIADDGDTEPLPALDEIIEGATLAPVTGEDPPSAAAAENRHGRAREATRPRTPRGCAADA